MKIYVVLALIFLAACAQETVQTEPIELCNFPYIEWRAGECCVDLDDNNVCDEHEIIPPPVVEEQSPVEDYSDIISGFLEVVPENYAFSSTDTGLVIVVGDKRRTLMDALSSGFTSIFWNTKTKEASAVCDSDEEVQQMRSSYDPETARCRVGMLSIKELSPSEYTKVLAGTEGPIDWMKKYENKVPFQVELGTQQLGARSINPVLQFKDPDGTMTVLRFDQYYKVPIRVERIKIVNNIQDKKVVDYQWLPEGVKGFPLIEKTVTIPTGKKTYEERNYELIIMQSYPIDENSMKISGYFKNTGLVSSPERTVKVECYDISGHVLGSSLVTIPPLAPLNTRSFQTIISGESDFLEDCLANVV